MRVAGFDWDDGNLAKCQKHGMSIAEIEHVLTSGPRIAPDMAHSQAEERYIAVGRTQSGRAAFVAFTLRQRDGQQRIRPVSARYMHRKESEAYAKTSPPSDH